MNKEMNNYNLVRLLAAFQVLLVHVFHHFSINGYIVEVLEMLPGVPIFFFVSGMLIYQSYIRSKSTGLISFYRKRILRIYPALIVCFIFSVSTLLLSGYLNFSDIFGSKFLLWVAAQLSFFQFYNPDLLREYGVGVLNGSLWTISVELQFYFLTPFLALLLKRSYKLFFLIFILSILLNFASHYILDIDSIITKLLRVSALPWVYFFCFGIFISYNVGLKRFLLNINYMHLVVLYLISMYFLGDVEKNSSNAINFLSAITLCVLILKIGEDKRLVELPLQTFVRSNDISYGLYIYHMPIINLAIYFNYPVELSLPFVLVFTFILALASWFFVERKALARKY